MTQAHAAGTPVRVPTRVEAGKIYLQGSQKDPLLATIPGINWDPKWQAWRLPATPFATQNILDRFRGRDDYRLLGGPDFKVLVAQAKGVSDLQAIKQAENLPPIPFAKTNPWLHQLRAFHFAKDLPAAYIAAGMATGKTAVAVHITAARAHHKILIVAPASVVEDEVWPDNFKRHSKRPILCASLKEKVGSVKDKMQFAKLKLHEAEQLGLPCAIILNYESAWRPPFGPEYKETADGKERRVSPGFALSQEWDCVIADECHRIQAVSGRASKFMAELAKRSKQRLGLSGTPFSSGPLSIYGQYRFLDPTIYGTRFQDFKSRYALTGGFEGKQVVGFQNQEELQRKFYSIAFRVETRDAVDLPEDQHIPRYCELGKEGRRAYQELERDFVTRVREGEVTANNALVKLLRLQQMTSGYARLDATDEEEGQTVRIDKAKQNLLADVLSDLDLREPVVVFARFRHDLDAIREVCEKQGRVFRELSGRVKETARWKDGDGDVLGVQIGAGAEGVDLTRAHYCCYFSLGFSLYQWDQSIYRCLRPSQKHKVCYIYLLVKDSVDEKVMTALRDKKSVVDNILGDLR